MIEKITLTGYEKNWTDSLKDMLALVADLDLATGDSSLEKADIEEAMILSGNFDNIIRRIYVRAFIDGLLEAQGKPKEEVYNTIRTLITETVSEDELRDVNKLPF